MRLPARPTIYEINTAVWLERLGRDRQRPLTLGEVPDSEWGWLAELPVDAVWLMGVWRRSPAGRVAAMAEPGLMAGYREVLADLRPEDVIGSPYCVQDYVVDPRFGGTAGLATARRELGARGLGLILDYVPNHVATDHPWTSEHPDYLIRGSEEDLAAHPDHFVRIAGGIAANGRDPYFPPWTDVVQLNAHSPDLRAAVADTLIAIGAQCDGLRCDMAMLLTNEIFGRTWGERAGPPPAEEFWPTVIARVRREHRDLLFIAEVYWDMEYTLQQQGFDHCYDKRLYDRLVTEPAQAVREHLLAGLDYQDGLIRFIENHDEPRAAATFGAEQARAAAVVMTTLPGARLYHDGQLDGWRKRIPVQLGRGPAEPADAGLRTFYERLLRAVGDAALREGAWSLSDCTGWADNDSCRHIVAWSWTKADRRHVVLVNLSGDPAQAQVRLSYAGLEHAHWDLSDMLTGERFNRSGAQLAGDGLYVALAPWGTHILEIVQHASG